jgi:hypothetical protein
MPLDVRWENGQIAIVSAPLPVKLEREGRLLLALPTKDPEKKAAKRFVARSGERGVD